MILVPGCCVVHLHLFGPYACLGYKKNVRDFLKFLKESERVFLVIVSIEEIGAKVGFWIAECFAIVSASLTAIHCQKVFFPIKTRLLKISPNIHATVC